MKNKRILFLLIFTIFLTSCSQKTKLSKTNAETSTNYENHNIKIKIANNIDEKENTYKTILDNLQKINNFSPIENLEIEISKKYLTPNLDNIIKCDNKFIETEEFKKGLIKKSYGIYDNWIVEGLYWKIFGTDTEDINFSTYYKDHDFSLFGVRFYEPFSSKEEIENIKSASIDLVEHLIANGKKEQLLENQIEISDIEKWAEDKNIDLAYQREIESLMNRMEVIDKGTQLIINTEEEINGFKININTEKIDEQYDTAEKIEQIILRFDRDILAIKKGIEEDAPNFYSEYKDILNNVPKVNYIFNENMDGGLCIKGDAKIYLGDILSQSHEYGHFLFYDPFIKKGMSISLLLWLDEGIVNYLDVAYSESHIERMSEDIEGYSTFKTDNLEVQNLFDNVLKIFIKNGIDIYNIDEIAKDSNKLIVEEHIRRIYKVKFHEIIGVINKYSTNTINSDPMYEGDTMNYHPMDYHLNFSFGTYLIEKYGLEKMLYLNITGSSQLTYEEVFRKSFKELEVDWINYLKDNIKDVDLIL